MTTQRPFARSQLLGGPVDIVQRRQVLDFIRLAVTHGGDRPILVGNQNLHSLYLSRREADLRRFYERADLIEIDSMPLIYWGRLLGLPLHRLHRATYLDWRDAFWRLADRENWRVFLLGGTPATVERAQARLERSFSGVTIGHHHGFFDRTPGGSEDQAVVRTINGFQPDVTLVGMGMPIQEIWIGQNLDELRSGVTLTVGAAIDYEAGAQSAAPRILGDLCLEWLYRLARDPRRLWRRYLVEPWALSGAALADLRRRPTFQAPSAPPIHTEPTGRTLEDDGAQFEAAAQRRRKPFSQAA